LQGVKVGGIEVKVGGIEVEVEVVVEVGKVVEKWRTEDCYQYNL
jgi:hypothetical protein